MRYFIAILLSIISFSYAYGEYAHDDEISDMALIYQGGTQRPDWTQEQLIPYVVHQYADGHIDWFFDSYLFYEFTDNWKIAFGYKYGTRNAKRADWEWLLNRIFEKGKSLDALNNCIEYYKSQIGAPNFKHKIVLGVVSPITDQTDWGELNGETLDFSKRSDQIKAAKWYIDQLIKRFYENNYNNLDLVGFYWLEESTAKCGDLPKDISLYIHELNKKFYWIPYWNAPGYDEWKELGFDLAFIQPNHFFNKDIIDSRLYDACRLAKTKNMGLEMEFDSKVLYENPDSYYSRLESYINAFEERGVFEKASIAYYSGTKAILDMYNSSAIENTLILDRIASNIKKRHDNIGSVELDNKDMDKVNIIVKMGEIEIVGEAKSIMIYSVDGTLISNNERLIQCPAGLYIIVIDGKSFKVIVK